MSFLWRVAAVVLLYPYCHFCCYCCSYSHMFTVKMRHTKSMTLRTLTHDNWRKQMSSLYSSFASDGFPSLSGFKSFIITRNASKKPSHTARKAGVQLQIRADLKFMEKKAEVFKVSRRSDHLYESCAVMHRSPWELLLPTLQSLNKTLPWLYCSLPGTECSVRHMQQNAVSMA